MNGAKDIPPIEQLLGSDFEEKRIIFTEEEDEKLLAYTKKRIEEQRQKNGK